jgi:RNA polymerase sigma-70 factor (ECF subfamily)
VAFRNALRKFTKWTTTGTGAYMDEKELIKRCKKRDRAAQKMLYDTYAPEMLGVCYRYTKSLDDAEDVLQEGFIKCFTHLESFKNDGVFAGWLRKIMVNTALSYLRKNSRYRNQMDFSAPVLHPVIDEMATPALQIEELMECVRRLPTGYQTIFNLVGIEGYSHNEVAKLLGISVQTSRSQYSRARTSLIQLIMHCEVTLENKKVSVKRL